MKKFVTYTCCLLLLSLAACSPQQTIPRIANTLNKTTDIAALSPRQTLEKTIDAARDGRLLNSGRIGINSKDTDVTAAFGNPAQKASIAMVFEKPNLGVFYNKNAIVHSLATVDENILNKIRLVDIVAKPGKPLRKRILKNQVVLQYKVGKNYLVFNYLRGSVAYGSVTQLATVTVTNQWNNF